MRDSQSENWSPQTRHFDFLGRGLTLMDARVYRASSGASFPCILLRCCVNKSLRLNSQLFPLVELPHLSSGQRNTFVCRCCVLTWSFHSFFDSNVPRHRNEE